MPKSGRSHWQWILAVLVLAILIAVIFRQDLFRTGGTPLQSGPGPTEPRSSGKQPQDGHSDLATKQVPAPVAGQGSVNQPAPDSWFMPVSFKGTVVDEDSRQPVAGARVTIYAYSSPPAVIDKVTGTAGTFQAEAPAAIRYGVRVEADGFRRFEEDSLVITRSYYDMGIALTPTLVLRGRVIDNAGRGVENALVHLRRGDTRAPSVLAVTTDQQGSFKITDIPRGGRYGLEAYHPGFAGQGAISVTIPSESEVIVRMLPVPDSGALTGAVTDTARQPVAGAAILLADIRSNQDLAVTRSDAQGLYRIAGIKDGNYSIRCFAEGYTQPRAGIITISGGREARQDFSLERERQIRGIVLGQNGEPVLQARVMAVLEDMQMARPQMSKGLDSYWRQAIMTNEAQRAGNAGVASTDSEGRFQIPCALDTTYRLIINHRDYLSLSTRARPSVQSQTYTLDPGLFLRGTVSDAQGAPVERFSLVLQSTSSRNEKAFSFTTTDGHFEIRGLARENYQLTLQASGRESYNGFLELGTSEEVYITVDPSKSTGRALRPLNIQRIK